MLGVRREPVHPPCSCFPRWTAPDRRRSESWMSHTRRRWRHNCSRRPMSTSHHELKNNTFDYKGRGSQRLFQVIFFPLGAASWHWQTGFPVSPPSLPVNFLQQNILLSRAYIFPQKLMFPHRPSSKIMNGFPSPLTSWNENHLLFLPQRVHCSQTVGQGGGGETKLLKYAYEISEYSIMFTRKGIESQFTRAQEGFVEKICRLLQKWKLPSWARPWPPVARPAVRRATWSGPGRRSGSRRGRRRGCKRRSTACCRLQ